MRHEREAAEHVGNDVDNSAAVLVEVLAVNLAGHQEGSRQVRLNYRIPPLKGRKRISARKKEKKEEGHMGRKCIKAGYR